MVGMAAYQRPALAAETALRHIWQVRAGMQGLRPVRWRISWSFNQNGLPLGNEVSGSM